MNRKRGADRARVIATVLFTEPLNCMLRAEP
jgi:hypothetical protein